MLSEILGMSRAEILDLSERQVCVRRRKTNLMAAIVPEQTCHSGSSSGIDRAIRQAERQLADADPVMKRLIAQHGRCPLAERNFEPFHMLANSIISQQLST